MDSVWVGAASYKSSWSLEDVENWNSKEIILLKSFEAVGLTFSREIDWYWKELLGYGLSLTWEAEKSSSLKILFFSDQVSVNLKPFVKFLRVPAFGYTLINNAATS